VHLPRDLAFAETDSYEGLAHLFAAADRGCGVIMISAHVGSPEFLARAAGYLGLDMLVLTEPLADPRINDLLKNARNTPGTRFVPADAAGLRATLAQLRNGGLVAIMADRDIQQRGRPVEFFGEPANLPFGPAELALRTGAAIVPGFVYRAHGVRKRLRYFPEVTFDRSGDREVDLKVAMSAVARALEAGILEAPGQWFALQPVWERASGRGRGSDA
jgi:KDO2-lipid IV(A) lauroyltransferase